MGYLIAEAAFSDVAWVPGSRLLAATLPFGVQFFDSTESYRKVGELPLSVGPAQISFSPNGELLSARGWKHEFQLLKVASGQTLFKLPPITTPLPRLRFNKEGTCLGALTGTGTSSSGRWREDRSTMLFP